MFENKATEGEKQVNHAKKKSVSVCLNLVSFVVQDGILMTKILVAQTAIGFGGK